MKPLALAFALALALPGVANAAAEPVWFEIGLRDPRTPQSYLLPLFDDELIEHAQHRLAERDNGDPGPIEDGRSPVELVQPQAPTAEGTQASEVVASAELEFVDCNRARLRVALGSAQLQTPRPAAYLAQAALRWALIPTPDGQADRESSRLCRVALAVRHVPVIARSRSPRERVRGERPLPAFHQF